MGTGLLQLAVAAAVVTGCALFIVEQSQPAVPCPPGPSWRHQAALLADMPEDAAGTLDPTALPLVAGVAADALRRVGWGAGTKFARYDAGASMHGALRRPWSNTGAFVLIVPGNGTLARRHAHVPMLTIDPAAASLGLALAPAAAALNAACEMVEAALGRRLFAFQLESASLPACRTGAGPCAVWEVGSGRVVLDSWLAGKMAGGAFAAEASRSRRRGLRALNSGRGGDAVLSVRDSGSAGSHAPGHHSEDGLPAVLAAFVDKFMAQLAPAAEALRAGEASLPSLASTFAQAGASAAVLALAGPPLWWCIACPLVLGMLAPFVFNFGLTAAAEALCAQLRLPDDTCNDLWWSAFALALMLSLGAAIPIVYICRLPQCGRRGLAAAAAAAGLGLAGVAAT